MPISLATHLLISVVHVGIDRSLFSHVQQVPARLTSLFPLNFFGEGVLDVPASVVRATLYLFPKLVGKSSREVER